MCGRYTVTKTPEEIEKRFQAEFERKDEETLFEPNYNAAPNQKLPVITNETPNKIVEYRWGLIPFWAKDASIGSRMINARAESLLEKPSFKAAFKKRRCLVIADGFYEWKKGEKEKIPYRITLKNGELFSFAGLWESWTDENDNKVRTFTIITTDANEITEKIHNRMPCILEKKDEKLWLKEELHPEDALKLLIQFPSSDMRAYEVSKSVNSPKNNNKDIIKPVEKGSKK